MARELVSKKTRLEFREFLVGWVLREIEGAFDAAGIERKRDYSPPTSGARRSLVEQYYASLDLTDPRDARKLLLSFEYVLHGALAVNTSPGSSRTDMTSAAAAKNLIDWLKRDGYDYVEGKIVPISGIARVADVRAAAQELDAPHLAESIHRIEAAIEADPSLAIGAAKELVETCCKTILSERGVAEDLDKLELAQLVKRAAKELALVPEAIADSARGADSIKRVLSNLASVTQGLAEIRNLYGTGHGKDGRRRGLGGRHAKLAVGAATALVTFLFETHWERTK